MTTDMTGGHDTESGAKERAMDAAAEVGAGAKNVAGVAKEEAGSVVHEAKSAGRGLIHDARAQLSDQASTQKQRAADGLRTVGSQLSSMAEGSESGAASTLVRNLSQRADSAAGWLSDREPADIVDDVRRFARRNTGAFIAIAVGLGVIAGRVTRALRSGEPDAGGQTGSGGTPALTGSTGAASMRDETPLATAVASGRDVGGTTGYGTGATGYAAGTTGAAATGYGAESTVPGADGYGTEAVDPLQGGATAGSVGETYPGETAWAPESTEGDRS
jgi:hypothetical protein